MEGTFQPKKSAATAPTSFNICEQTRCLILNGQGPLITTNMNDEIMLNHIGVEYDNSSAQIKAILGVGFLNFTFTTYLKLVGRWVDT